MPMIVNYDTGERRVRPYSEFFAPPEMKDFNFNTRVELAEESMRKMVDYSANMNSKLSEYLVEVLREWSSAKTAFIDLEPRIEAEKDKIRRVMEAKVAALGKELSRQQQLQEKNLEKIRILEKKIQEYSKMEIEFQICKEKLEAAEFQLAEVRLQLSELKTVNQALIDEGKVKKNEMAALNHTISQLQKEVTKLENHCESISKTSNELSEALQTMTNEKEVFKVRKNYVPFFYRNF
jgi:chromosome segregation ATPase